MKWNFKCLVDPCVFPVCSASYKVFIIRKIRISVVFRQRISIFFTVNLSDCCREKFGMSNWSNILSRASPWEAFQNTTVVCEQNLFKVDVFYEWQECMSRNRIFELVRFGRLVWLSKYSKLRVSDQPEIVFAVSQLLPSEQIKRILFQFVYKNLISAKKQTV